MSLSVPCLSMSKPRWPIASKWSSTGHSYLSLRCFISLGWPYCCFVSSIVLHSVYCPNHSSLPDFMGKIQISDLQKVFIHFLVRPKPEAYRLQPLQIQIFLRFHFYTCINFAHMLLSKPTHLGHKWRLRNVLELNTSPFLIIIWKDICIQQPFVHKHHLLHCSLTLTLCPNSWNLFH